MKILYIEAQKKQDKKENTDFSSLLALPKELFIAYSIQYKPLAEEIKAYLSRHSYTIGGFQQVLGCTKLKVKNNLPILLIGSGRFHALNLALQNKDSNVYIYNSSSVSEIQEKDLEEIKKNKEINLKRFVLAKKIGIIISTKPGQENLNKAELLKQKINKKYPEKQVFFFISNNINLAELENFSIDFWISSACPGLINDSKKLTNIDDILEFL